VQISCRVSLEKCLSQPAYALIAPNLRVPNEGPLGAEKQLEGHLDKLLEGGGVNIHLWCNGLLYHLSAQGNSSLGMTDIWSPDVV
jgi:hypothetical protein